MADFQKIKVGFNQFGYNTTIQEYEGRRVQFQNLVNEAINTGLNFQFGENDLVPFVTDPKTFFCDKLITTPVEINNVTLDKSKVFDLMDVPAALTNLINKIIDLNKNGLRTPNDPIFIIPFANDFLIENNIVTLKEDVRQRIEDIYSIFINSQKQKNIVDKLNIIIDNLQSIKELNPIFNYEDLFEKYIDALDGKNTISINFKVIKDL